MNWSSCQGIFPGEGFFCSVHGLAFPRRKLHVFGVGEGYG